MTIQFDCEHCGKTLKTDDSKAGRRVKCPACSGLLTIPEAVDEAVESPADFNFAEAPLVGRSKLARSVQREDDESADVCEMCGEELPPQAKRCPACGEPCPGAKSSRRGRKSAGELASLGNRFLGAMLDGLVGLVLVAPGYALIVFADVQGHGPNSNAEGLLLLGLVALLLGFLVLLGLQVWLMATRSQSIGKYLMKTQVMDFDTNQRAGFVKVFLLRLVVNQMIASVPCIGGIYALVDICFIFGDDRRCLHDKIAGTYVANYQA